MISFPLAAHTNIMQRNERSLFPYDPIQGIIGAWQEAITRLIERGVTGKILLANLGSLKGFPVSLSAGRRNTRHTT